MATFTITEADTNANIDKKEFCTYVDNTEFSDEIKESIKGMFGVVTASGENDINLDFVDFQKIINHGGIGFCGIGELEGVNSATEAIKLAIKDSSFDYNLMHKISGILIHFTIHPDLPITQIAEAMEIIDENADYEADIFWGTTTDEAFSKNYVKASVLFTGFRKNSFENMLVNNVEFRRKK